MENVYDDLGRLTQKLYTATDGSAYSPAATYSYIDRSSDTSRTTGTVRGIDYSYTSGDLSVSDLYYVYDANGNITAERTWQPDENNPLREKYAYDGKNQLIRHDSVTQGKSFAYEYDAGGNILSKSEYDYTTGELGAALNTVNYTYGDSSWGDLLTAYNGQAITYDTIGNPTSYLGWSFDWTGRSLTGATKDSQTLSFTYNSNGIRTSKTVNGVKTEYLLNGTQILAQKTGSNTLCFFYDQQGNRVGMADANNRFYYYLYNIQGDVIAIADASTGKLVATYKYDAWGNCTVQNADGWTAGDANPFRYRGYYYDTETGLYYLNSRYYDPEVGRFINADNQLSTGDMTGMNLFAYCGNNPVNRVDYTGQFWSEIWEFAKTAVAEIGKAMGLMSPAYAGCGGAALADGPLPFGDIVAVAGAALLTVGAIGYGIYQATQAPAISIPKIDEKSEAIVVTKEPDSPVIFPVDPNTFNPVGLVKVPRAGTKNGALISWMDPLTNTEVFRWDENPNYSNGPHYHIYGTGHYYPGTIVPEPYATIYFPFR